MTDRGQAMTPPPDRFETEARELCNKIREQNWKIGGVIVMDVEEAEALILAFARRAHAAGLREAGKIINESAGSLDSVRETVLDRAAELEAEAQTKGAPHEP